ncbi:hypothetical protein AGR2A_Cc100177 [Agrobacterium genomosp. 2 str. CFBP 5494]|uniref:Uncharacterized protein n=1 Tax=Agrobacterium genomosp. 2 str. CFBP 5494 TaxID=1183436 RepID=A0A9W5AXI8_9HYPH|nr:hypothetical protein AGR2A_Cc100177 [Agrobacterium genomosp. 2 str. CFBP 5494]
MLSIRTAWRSTGALHFKTKIYVSRKADTIHAIILLGEMAVPTGETFNERELSGSDTGRTAGSGYIGTQRSGDDGECSCSG